MTAPALARSILCGRDGVRKHDALAIQQAQVLMGDIDVDSKVHHRREAKKERRSVTLSGAKTPPATLAW